MLLLPGTQQAFNKYLLNELMNSVKLPEYSRVEDEETNHFGN